MIGAEFITLSGELSYPNIEIYTEMPSDVPRVFERQLAWRCPDGVFFCDVDNIMLIKLWSRKISHKRGCGFHASKISLSGVVYENVYVFMNCHDIGVPDLLHDQITFTCDDGTFLTNTRLFSMFQL